MDTPGNLASTFLITTILVILLITPTTTINQQRRVAYQAFLRYLSSLHHSSCPHRSVFFLRKEGSDKNITSPQNAQNTKDSTPSDLSDATRAKESLSKSTNLSTKKPFLSTGKLNQTVLHKTPTGINSSVTTTDIKSTEKDSPLISNVSPSPLTCSSLGNTDNIVKAGNIVYKLSMLVSKPKLNLSEPSGSVLLPSKLQILTGKSKLKSQIKNMQRKKDLKKAELETVKEDRNKRDKEKEEQMRKAEIIYQAQLKKEVEAGKKKDRNKSRSSENSRKN